jgi:hypothetical protein
MTYDQLAPLVGRRVRLTARNGYQRVGLLTTHDYGHCVDYLIDNQGGFPLESYDRLEVMGPNGRYEVQS